MAIRKPQVEEHERDELRVGVLGAARDTRDGSLAHDLWRVGFIRAPQLASVSEPQTGTPNCRMRPDLGRTPIFVRSCSSGAPWR